MTPSRSARRQPDGKSGCPRALPLKTFLGGEGSSPCLYDLWPADFLFFLRGGRRCPCLYDLLERLALFNFVGGACVSFVVAEKLMLSVEVVWIFSWYTFGSEESVKKTRKKNSNALSVMWKILTVSGGAPLPAPAPRAPQPELRRRNPRVLLAN